MMVMREAGVKGKYEDRKKGKSIRQEIPPESEIKIGHLEESYLREL